MPPSARDEPTSSTRAAEGDSQPVPAPISDRTIDSYEDVPQQTHAAGAQGTAKRHLLPPAERARQMKAGHVHARDEEQEPDGAEQNQRRAAHARGHPIRPGGIQVGADASGGVARELLMDRRSNAIDGGGSLPRDATAKSPDDQVICAVVGLLVRRGSRDRHRASCGSCRARRRQWCRARLREERSGRALLTLPSNVRCQSRSLMIATSGLPGVSSSRENSRPRRVQSRACEVGRRHPLIANRGDDVACSQIPAGAATPCAAIESMAGARSRTNKQLSRRALAATAWSGRRVLQDWDREVA